MHYKTGEKMFPDNLQERIILAQCCLTISVTWHVTVFFLLEANSIAVSTERGWFWQLCDPDTSLSLSIFSALLSWLISGLGI